MSMSAEPHAINKYRAQTRDGRPALAFGKTRVCKCCRKPRSSAQYTSATARMCNQCKGLS